MILYSILTSYFVKFFLSFFLLLTYDAVMLAKKKNVKSCIIYEICIKELCNSIINKILIQFLEPVVQLRFFVVLIGSEDLVINGLITEIYKKQPVKVLSTSSGSPWPPALPVQDIL